MQDNESQLHPIEKSLLKTLASNQPMSIENLSHITGLNIDQVRRGIEWLKYKNLISMRDKKSVSREKISRISKTRIRHYEEAVQCWSI
jgi:phenylalanyl-tRNA synthetase alpha chain